MTTWLIIVVAIQAIAMFLVLVGALDLARGYRKLTEAQHSYCVSAISEFTSDRLIAQWLRANAERWDDVTMQPLLSRLARERYQPGGPSMPAIWMNYEADRLDPKEAS